ncbi:MAG: DUF362 domain-containing protein [Candidatus Zixiibacteriota bacterium]
MSSKLYFIDSRVEKFDYQYSVLGRLEKTLEEIDLGRYFSKGELVPIKMHLGNLGAHHTIRPNYIRLVVDHLKKVGAKPFVTDSVRVRAYEYLEVANQMGYNPLSLGAPVIIADGIFGLDSIKVKAGEILKELYIPSAIYDATSMMVLTHVKGHIDSSYAGAIKNLAMGCVTAVPRGCEWKDGGRGKMHFQMEQELMSWNESLCTFCGICANNCPQDAIEVKADLKMQNSHYFKVDERSCWRCGRCVRVCPEGALTVPTSMENFQISLAEATKAVLSTFKSGKVFYINFLMDIQPECDCMPISDTPVVQDQGILLGDDIVAVDKASLDLIVKAQPLPYSKAEGIKVEEGSDVLSMIHRKDAKVQIEAAEKMGLGKMAYELVRV